MFVKLFSITEVGETIARFGHECEIVDAKYLFSVRQENVIGVYESKLKPKDKTCYSFGYVDVANKSKLLETKNAQEISKSNIVEVYYEVFLNEEARKLIPNVQRYYTDSDSYYRILEKYWEQTKYNHTKPTVKEKM